MMRKNERSLGNNEELLSGVSGQGRSANERHEQEYQHVSQTSKRQESCVGEYRVLGTDWWECRGCEWRAVSGGQGHDALSITVSGALPTRKHGNAHWLF